MEEVLSVYTRPRDPDCPLVCLDESNKQLIKETRLPVPMKKGQPARRLRIPTQWYSQPIHDPRLRGDKRLRRSKAGGTGGT
jgi:hypothetical protein